MLLISAQGGMGQQGLPFCSIYTKPLLLFWAVLAGRGIAGRLCCRKEACRCCSSCLILTCFYATQELQAAAVSSARDED